MAIDVIFVFVRTVWIKMRECLAAVGKTVLGSCDPNKINQEVRISIISGVKDTPCLTFSRRTFCDTLRV